MEEDREGEKDPVVKTWLNKLKMNKDIEGNKKKNEY